MARMVRFLIVLTGLSLLGPPLAHAKRPTAPPAEPPADGTDTADAPEATDAPEAAPVDADADGDAAAAGAPAASVARAATHKKKRDDVAYGMGLRGRVVSMPGWMLGLFTKNNVPLLTLGHVGLELFRRHKNFQLMVSLSYQNMSPANGNWLGIDHDAATDVKYIQFKGLALYAIDVSFIWQTMFTDWIGMHYGAGIGVAYVAGSIQHNDSTVGCNDGNVSNLEQCHPPGVTCANGSCTPDSALQAGRGSYSEVPPAVPIVNVVLGVDFRVPSIRGWEAKIEGGFYDAFFVGAGVGYTF
jgi:hypothetical protein